MGNLTLTVIAVALVDCINPTLIGGELFVATGPHPRRRVVSFTLGAFVATLGLGLVLALGLGDLILSVLPKPGPTVKWALVTAAGVVLLGGGVMIWVRRAALISSDPTETGHGPQGPAALVGAGLAGVELLSAFPYFAAIAMIIGSEVANVGKVALIGLYCVVYCLPLIVIAAIFLALGERADRTLEPFNTWLLGHWPLVVAPLTAIMGVAVATYGVIQLSSL